MLRAFNMTPESLYLSPTTKDRAVASLICMNVDRPYRLRFVPVSERTIEQNSKLHAMLRDISSQCEWCGKKYSMVVWKRLFVAAVKGQDTLPGLEGGVVIVSDNSSSELPIHLFSDLIEYIYAWGAKNDVQWSEPE